MVLGRSLLRAGVLALAAVCLPAHAVFFFLLPLGLFTAKGDTCVKNEAKVGDRITRPDGSLVVIKTLNGTSVKCSSSSYPIVAEVEPASGTLPANESQARIDLPDGWVDKPVTESMKSGGVAHYWLNATLDAGLQLATWPRPAVDAFAEFVASKKAFQMTKLHDSEQFPTSHLVVNGAPAMRYEVRGRAPNGTAYWYSVTFIQGDKEIVGLYAWTSSGSFEQSRPKLVAIASSVTGLVTPPPVLATPVQPASTGSEGDVRQESARAAPSANSAISAISAASSDGAKTTASRLRELSDLFRDGLINQEEYESKRKKVMDSL